MCGLSLPVYILIKLKFGVKQHKYPEHILVPYGSSPTSWLLWSDKLQSYGLALFSKTLTLISAIKADTLSAISGAGLGATITVLYCCGWGLKLSVPLLSFIETISVEQGEADIIRWIWVDNNRNDMNSEHILHQLNNKIIGLLTQEAYGSTSERILLGYGFSFHSPKPWLFFWISPHQNCTQTSRHHRNPLGLWFAFQDLREHVWRCNIRTLNYSSGSITKGNNCININNFNDILRYDERCKAEYQIACSFSVWTQWRRRGKGQRQLKVTTSNMKVRESRFYLPFTNWMDILWPVTLTAISVIVWKAAKWPVISLQNASCPATT